MIETLIDLKKPTFKILTHLILNYTKPTIGLN